MVTTKLVEAHLVRMEAGVAEYSLRLDLQLLRIHKYVYSTSGEDPGLGQILIQGSVPRKTGKQETGCSSENAC